MAYIVNLSSIHTLNPVSTGIYAFADLCDNYSDNCCKSYCPGFFSSPTNKAWVLWQYYRNLKTIINSYKLGKINTTEFLRRIKKIFNFLPENEADQLLIDAWNSIISFQQDDAVKFKKINEISKKEPVYLISNSNELNVIEILKLLKQNFPDTVWEKNIDLLAESTNQQPIKIAPNIYLCLSYKYGLFKTDGLLKKVVDEQGNGQLSNIKVVSQFKPDRDQACAMGISNKSIFSSDEFYQSSTVSYKMR